jgi:hypothetical protein
MRVRRNSSCRERSHAVWTIEVIGDVKRSESGSANVKTMIKL